MIRVLAIAWMRSVTIDPGYAAVNQNRKAAIGDIDGDGRNDVVIGPAEAYRGGKANG